MAQPHAGLKPALAAGLSTATRHRLADEFAARRQALASACPPGSLIVVPGHPDRYQQQSVPFRFRQQADLLYLTGWAHPNAVLVIDVPKHAGASITSTLFVEQLDSSRVLWDGASPGVKEAVEEYGVDEAEPIGKLSNALRLLAEDRRDVFVTDAEPANGHLHQSIRKQLSAVSRQALLHSCTAALDKLRARKSPEELRMIQEACKRSARAYAQALKRVVARVRKHGAIDEAVIDAELMFAMTDHGCSEYFYPPVVAGGANGLTLHYVKNSGVVRVGETVLIDAGGMVGPYGADISRTYPVGGDFTSAQRELYEAVLDVQLRLIKLCMDSPGNITISRLSELSVNWTSENLKAIGIPHTRLQLTETLYPHSVGHHLGLNIHDCGSVSRSENLGPGSVITIEPGAYIPHDSAYPEKFRGLAVRIEDDIAFMYDGSVQNLTEAAPKLVADIQNVQQEHTT